MEQVHKLLESVRGQRLEMLLTLALTTGMRRGEMLALRWTDVDLERQTVKVLVEAGLPHRSFHNLRHSAATLLLSWGVPLKVIQEILGHSNFAITANVYTDVLPSLQKEAMDKWDDAFRPDNQGDEQVP